MSVWVDLRNRGRQSIKKEDEHIVYNNHIFKPETLVEEEYGDAKYIIMTTGSYPFIFIEKPLNLIGSASFEGKSTAVIELANKEYEMDRNVNNDVVTFTYTFNKEDDYVCDVHPGKKYSVDELKEYAKNFIDSIKQKEDVFARYAMHHNN